MKTRKIKFTSFLLAIFFSTAAFICFNPVWVTAQKLEAGDIIYSRLPAAPSASGTIWAVRQDGTNDRQIALGSQPRLSPDGRFLLFRRNQMAGEPYRFGQIFVLDLATKSETLLLSYGNNVIGYSFTPDSTQIIFDDGNFTGLRRIDRDGKNPVSAGGFSAFDDFPVSRSGDGLIAYYRNDNSTIAGIYTLTASGVTAQLVPDTTGGSFPSWSPDGQFIAFGSASPTGYPYNINNLFKIKPDGRGKVQLTNMAANNNIGAGFAWTTDGAKLIIAANIKRAAGLYAIGSNGSGAPVPISISNGAAPDFVGGIVPDQTTNGSPGYQLLQSVIAGGGGTSTSGNYSMTSTFGEAVAGIGSAGGSFNLQSGFWTNNSLLNKALFDFDGDGKTDVAIFRPGPGEWWYLKSSNSQATAAQFGSATDKITPGDFTGDGKTDIAFWRPSNGFWFILRSEDNSFFSFPFGANGDIPIVGDFDADGSADPTIFRPSTGEWFILKSSGGTLITTFGTTGDKPVAADYDGDSKTDIAIFRPSDGSWWYLRSSDGQSRVYRFGVSTDKQVPGDYTGDGKADIAIFRPSTGEWFVQRSEDNSFYSFPFGAPGDIPAPGDYDGDGKFDSAVFRPSTSTWYLNQTTAGVGILTFGSNGDRPVPNAFVP